MSTPTVIDPSHRAPESTSLVARSEAFLEITSDLEYESAGTFLVAARAWVAGLWDHFEAPLKAQFDAWKAGRAAVSALTDPVTAKADAIDAAIKVYRRKKEEEAAAEQRRLEAAQREQERIEREAAALMAEEDGDEVQAEQIREAPSTAPPAQIARTFSLPLVAGLSNRKTWKAEVEDLKKLAGALVAGTVPTGAFVGLEVVGENDKGGRFRSAFLDARAKEWKSLLSQHYPGVRAYEDDTTVTKKR